MAKKKSANKPEPGFKLVLHEPNPQCCKDSAVGKPIKTCECGLTCMCHCCGCDLD